MENNTKNIPPYAEERIIQQKQLIPTNFIELKSEGKKNNWGNTEGLPKSLCERYTFSYENKWFTLDIEQKLHEKLGLENNKNCPCPFYVSEEVLKRETECGGITIKNENEILLIKKEVLLIKEKETQTDLSNIINIKQVEELEKRWWDRPLHWHQVQVEVQMSWGSLRIPLEKVLDKDAINQLESSGTIILHKNI